MTDWDPCSKQPIFKTAAAAIRVLEPSEGQFAPAPTTTASAPASGEVPPTRGDESALAAEQFSEPTTGGTK